MIPSPRDPDRSDRGGVDALTAAARAGDRDAFGELYTLHYGAVFAFVRRRVATPQLAEDLVSETFIRAMRSIETFVWFGGGFIGWLITIARNLVADYYKSAFLRRECVTREFCDTDWLCDGPEDIVVERMDSETVHAAVANLNPLQRRCIEARFLGELSLAETAELLDCGEGAVKALQYRATRTLARDPRLTAGVAS
jgi:RNA polymerase sigma-70 factor (ECF subfamily)